MLQSRWATKTETAAPAQDEEPATAPAAEKDNAPSYEPAYEDASIDPFAQTASADHLFFDDDITPIAEPVVEPPTANVISSSLPPQSQPEPAPHAPAPVPREPRSNDRGGRGRGRARARGRGGPARGRGGAAHAADLRDTADSKAQTDTQNAAAKDSESLPAPAAADSPSNQAMETPATPSAPADAKEKPPHSVRGDRTLTGGTARTRLTEEQLNAKLANMRSKNEALQTAHARAEADQAKFEAREAVLKKQDVERKKILAEKQKQERQNRAQMMGERERNRLRKLNALGGREWDFEKEQGFSGTGEEKSRAATRGAHGGVAPSRTTDTGLPSEQTEQANAPQPSRGRARGRGGRGNRGGRGDHQGSHPADAKKREEQQPPSAADFPELPSSTGPAQSKDVVAAPKNLEFPVKSKTTQAKTSEPERPAITKQESFGLPSPMEKGRSWADEVS